MSYEVGLNIKKFRNLKKLTQVELAKRANISRSYLADVERGRYNPSIETLITISKALDVELATLLGGDRDIPVELSEKLRLILMELSEGPIHNREFPQHIKEAITPELKRIMEQYNIHFQLTPDGIMEQSRKLDDGYLVVEIIKTLETVKESTAEYNVPDWATPKDKRDFKKMLESDAPLMFDGVPIEGEARQRVMDILTGLFWEAKEKNKVTYGRKRVTNNENEDHKKE